MERKRFSPLGLMGGIVLPFVLVYGTWNPWGRSFYHWAVAPFFSGRPAIGPVKVLVALLLLAGWVVVIHATSRSLGLGGAVLIAAIFGVLVWLLIAKGVPSNRTAQRPFRTWDSWRSVCSWLSG